MKMLRMQTVEIHLISLTRGFFNTRMFPFNEHTFYCQMTESESGHFMRK